jgi:hypothetical protein
MMWFLINVAPWIAGTGTGIYVGFLSSRRRRMW